MEIKNIFLFLTSSALLMTCAPKGVRIFTLHQTYEDSRVTITFEDCSETDLVFTITTLQDNLDSFYDRFDFIFTGVGIIDNFDVFVNDIETLVRNKTTTFYDVVIQLTESDMNRFVNDSCALEIWGITFDII